MQYFDLARQGQRAMAKRWQGLKLHGRVWGPRGTCFAQVLKPSKCRGFRPGKAAAKGERCTGTFRVLVKRAWRRFWKPSKCRIFDLAKQLAKGYKGAQEGFVSLSETCLRAGVEIRLNAIFRLGKARAKGDGKGLARG